ncbi:hypothetical protein FKM82_018789 [Ascaphus truei]
MSSLTYCRFIICCFQQLSECCPLFMLYVYRERNFLPTSVYVLHRINTLLVRLVLFVCFYSFTGTSRRNTEKVPLMTRKRRKLCYYGGKRGS